MACAGCSALNILTSRVQVAASLQEIKSRRECRMMTSLRQVPALHVDALLQAMPPHKREQAVCAGTLMVAACPAAGRCSTGLPAAQGQHAAQGRSPHLQVEATLPEVPAPRQGH